MKAPFSFDLRTQLLDPRRMAHQDALLSLAEVEALKLNERGFVTNSVSGTAIAGTRTDNDTFTRSAGYWVDEVKIDHGGYTGIPVLGEEVTETTSGAKGKLKEITSTHIVIRFPITVAAFVGDKLLTGAGGFTCTGNGTIVTDVSNLAGQWVYSHKSGDLTDGLWMQVVSNTSTTVDVDGTLHSTGTAIILFSSASAARDAISMDVAIDEYSAMQVISASAATVTLTSTSGKHQLVIADTGSNNVAITLPDTRTLPQGAQIFFYGKDATTNAITVVSPVAAQTLDGTDISSGGTPFADINADDDYMVIEMRNNLWTTQVDGIS